MVKDLKNYLKDATNYLGFVSKAEEPVARQKVLDFCVRHELDQKFLNLVANNVAWQRLATQKEVMYFVDVISNTSFFAEDNGQIIDISILTLDILDPKPVIKVITSKDILM